MSSAGRVDAIVIGGGIAGVSLAYELASDRSVCLVETERTLAFHTTGRSAATLAQSYGSPVVRALTKSGLDLMEDPPEHFDRPILTPRATLWFAREHGAESALAFQAEAMSATPLATPIAGRELIEACPFVRPEIVAIALIDHSGQDIDVPVLHQGYVRGLKARGGSVRAEWKVVAVECQNGSWTVWNGHGDSLTAPLVVNAAGAWSDEIAALAGVRSPTIEPRRRSVFIAPSAAFPARPQWPTLASLDGEFYVKPEGHQFLCSPIDATPESPGDPRPDTTEIARAIDDINAATMLGLRSVSSSWAGLRNFAPDGLPVIGPDPDRDGFFWLAGQGGFGIQTAPGIARLAAGLIRDDAVPVAIAAHGITRDAVGPQRFLAPSR